MCFLRIRTPNTRAVRRIHIPPKSYTADHDIAMLTIDEIEFSDWARPICLPM